MKVMLSMVWVAILLLVQSSVSQQRFAEMPGDTPAAPGKSATAQAFAEDAERELVRLLNRERTQRGLQPLAMDQRLRQAARKHSLHMAEQHVLSHGFAGEAELPQRLASAGIRFDRSGENVAFGSTVEQVHEGLMKSPPHRANILNPDFSAAGVGAVQRDGLLWVTQDFAHRLEFRTESEVERLLGRRFDEVRRQAGRKPVRRERVPGLQEAACSMAGKGKLDTSRARALFGGRAGAAAYSGAELADLPSAWRKVAAMPALQRYAVGVCFQESEQFPSGGYWAVLVFE